MDNDKFKDKTSCDNCENSKFHYKFDEHDKEIFSRIMDILNNNKFNYSHMIKGKNNKELYNWLMEKTKHITDPNINVSTRLYMLIHDIHDIPRCKTCGNEIGKNVININEGFVQYCNTKCSMNDIKIREKIGDVMFKKYGNRNPSQIPEFREKFKQTLMEKYGVEHPMQIKGAIQKIKNTKLERYGDPNYNNMKKTVETCLKRYGVKYSTQTERMKKKSEETCLERYGVKNPGCLEEIKRKVVETNLKKYGCIHAMQLKHIREKANKTCMEKYGVTSPIFLEQNQKKSTDEIKRLSYDNILMKNEYDYPVWTKEEYVEKYNKNEEMEFICRKCGNTFSAIHCNGVHHKCPSCYPMTNGDSIEEKEVLGFIKSVFHDEVNENIRTIIHPYELDIYIPSLKIAFEYDGLYWHSIMEKDKKYHLMKTKMCEENGIQLIHIFENEWLFKTDIVKSRIRNLIGLNDKKFFARKCSIEEISSPEAVCFMDKNHIQGGINSSINIGLKAKDNLVAVMSFSKERFGKKYEYELTRFCTDRGTSVIGGASRLLKYFERKYNPKSLVSYADRRWSNGNMYKKLGFTLDHISPPCYWYFRNGEIECLRSRIEFQKHKLKTILPKFDPSKSEIVNMMDNGWNAIYDCGNYVFKKEYN